MPTIANAPLGEDSSLDGTEKIPASGSKYILISTIASYIRTLTQILTGKTINLTDNTLTGTKAQFNTAVSDGDIAFDAFKTISVAGQSDVVADSATDTLTLAAGSNVTITTNATTDTITIAASGSGSGDVVGPASATDNAVTRFDSTTGKLVQNSAVTIDDSGTVNIPTGQTYNINGSAHTHSYAPNAFATVAVSGQSDVVADGTADTLTLAAGSNVTITTDAGTDTVTIAASGGASDSFKTIAVSGQSDVVADSATDTLTLVAGSNVTLTTDATTDSVTIAMSGVGGVTGPGSSTDNAIARFDGTGGGTIQNSAVTVDDTGVLGLPDNVRQTFNPGANAAGINVGSVAGDPDTPSNGDLWYDSTANELTARINSANVALGAGGSFWNQVVNEDGSSFANWTAGSGTWSSDGTVIKQTNTTGKLRARFNTKLPLAFMVFEAEIQIKTAGDKTGGLIIGYDGVNGGNGALVALNETNGVQFEKDATSAVHTVALTINVDTWYKVRMVSTGSLVTAYVDDVLIGSAGTGLANSNNATYIGLLTSSAEVWFRNIKAWVPTLPT